jgi:hypothetical protein
VDSGFLKETRELLGKKGDGFVGRTTTKLGIRIELKTKEEA